jgi:hypothetical protein
MIGDGSLAVRRDDIGDAAFAGDNVYSIERKCSSNVRTQVGIFPVSVAGPIQIRWKANWAAEPVSRFGFRRFVWITREPERWRLKVIRATGCDLRSLAWLRKSNGTPPAQGFVVGKCQENCCKPDPFATF